MSPSILLDAALMHPVVASAAHWLVDFPFFFMFQAQQATGCIWLGDSREGSNQFPLQLGHLALQLLLQILVLFQLLQTLFEVLTLRLTELRSNLLADLGISAIVSPNAEEDQPHNQHRATSTDGHALSNCESRTAALAGVCCLNTQALEDPLNKADALSTNVHLVSPCSSSSKDAEDAQAAYSFCRMFPDPVAVCLKLEDSY
mmetsp:Transcript_92849/g.194053  ORF Transcript_92849/g.194053 Transcript_92849/m.194053 type:complete len:202 (-) Transcript_92849:627-1232(-)